MQEKSISKIGFGGGCHWCTEAIFQSLKGVTDVRQGYIGSAPPHEGLSEAVVVSFDSTVILLEQLITIHLHTHNSQSNHSFRKIYRSAVYWYDEKQEYAFAKAIQENQLQFKQQIITQFLPFKIFKESRKSIQNYYKKQPNAPFCERYILPKLEKIELQFKEYSDIRFNL